MKQRIIQWITSKRWMNGRVEMSWRLTVGGLWWHVDVDVQHVTMLRWFPIRLMDFADWIPTKCWLIASGCSFLLSAFILTDHRYGRLRWWCEWFGFIMDTGIEIKLDTYTLKHTHTHGWCWCCRPNPDDDVNAKESSSLLTQWAASNGNCAKIID